MVFLIWRLAYQKWKCPYQKPTKYMKQVQPLVVAMNPGASLHVPSVTDSPRHTLTGEESLRNPRELPSTPDIFLHASPGIHCVSTIGCGKWMQLALYIMIYNISVYMETTLLFAPRCTTLMDHD